MSLHPNVSAMSDELISSGELSSTHDETLGQLLLGSTSDSPTSHQPGAQGRAEVCCAEILAAGGR